MRRKLCSLILICVIAAALYLSADLTYKFLQTKEILAFNLSNLSRTCVVIEQSTGKDCFLVDGRFIVDHYGFERFERAF